MSDASLHAEAVDAYEIAFEAATENRNAYLEDFKFSRLSEQWPEAIKNERSAPGRVRPMLTINKMPAFGRQVVNDIRQNRPAIKVRPADSAADIETALVMSGLIRNIENTSNASVAYDTAAECAVYGGFGYFRIEIDYACDDSFEQDIKICRIANPLSVIGDPYSQAADSSDWDMAFICELLSRDQFKDQYPGADATSFDSLDDKIKRNWTNGDDVLVAEYWRRDKVDKKILLMTDGTVVDAESYEQDREIFEVQGITVKAERTIKAHRVRQCILNGNEVLTKRTEGGKEKQHYDWPGKYIPIVPVYGDEINIEGKRIFQSMIHDAKDAQRQLNYWETTATELVALSPRVPWIGKQGTFSVDKNWLTANSANHPFLEYKGEVPPQRQQIDSGPAIGAMTQAKQASDNMKAVLGMYDASLGNRSNETSGVAIDSRKLEGETGQFHFSDNLMRAIRHGGLIILDLIPKVYTKDRIVRVLGDDGTAQNVKLGPRQGPAPTPGQQVPPPESGVGEPMPFAPTPYPEGAPPPRIGALDGVFDLGMGKYDLTVEAGPSFTTQRQETAAQIGEFLRAFPQAAPVVGDILVKNFDWKDADEISRRLHKLLPPALKDEGPSPELQQAQQQIAQMTQAMQEMMRELETTKMDNAAKVEKAKADQAKAAADQYSAETERMKAQNEAAMMRDQQQTMILNSAAPDLMAGFQALMQQIQALAAPKITEAVAVKEADGVYRLRKVETMAAPNGQGGEMGGMA